MAVFECYLINKRAIGEWEMKRIETRLAGLLGGCCKYSGKFDSARALHWIKRPEDVGPHELVCYLLHSRRDSVIARRYRREWPDEQPWRAPEGVSGATWASQEGVISEVYFDTDLRIDPHFPDLGARIIFHELLHNKTDALESDGVKDLHAHAKESKSLFRHRQDYDTPLRDDVAKLMGSRMPLERKQYMGETSSSTGPEVEERKPRDDIETPHTRPEKATTDDYYAGAL